VNDLKRRLVSLTLLALFNASVYSAPFDLFNQDRGEPPKAAPKATSASATKKATPKKVAPKKRVAMKPQKDFILRGVSRLGKQYRAILELPDGKQKAVRWKPGQKIPIAGFSAYKITNIKIQDRSVTVTYPKNSSCRKSNDKKGVTCSTDKKSATLNLAFAKPTAAPPPTKAINKDSLAQKQKNRITSPNQAPLVKQFQQKIKDQDIPEGMRRVRTPFGDRLVPDTQ